VHLVSPSDGLQVVRSFILPASQGRDVPVNGPTFKQIPGMSPLVGANIPPHSAFVIVLELAVPSAGSRTSRGVRLDYSVGGSNYQAAFPDWIRVCAPEGSAPSCSNQPLPTS
jgi:hypothetical protein